MSTTADFKNGMTIEYNGQLFTIIQFLHVKPGKGPAFVRTKLKNVKTGKVIENTFNSGVKVNTVRVERRPYQYLYKAAELPMPRFREIAKTTINAKRINTSRYFERNMDVISHAA